MIIAAALRKNGEVYIGRNHSVIFLQREKGYLQNAEQGFVTDKGIFIDRFSGLEVATECNQIIHKHPSFDKLYSEDIIMPIKEIERMEKIKIVLSEYAKVPEYQTLGAAGMDLHSAENEEIIIKPRSASLVLTGLRVQIPEGYEMQIRPRSGLALKYGITVLNTPGTIDSDYRGEIGIILMNHSDEPFSVNKGDRIAQAVLTSVETAIFEVVESLENTERGEGGFGHTNKE